MAKTIVICADGTNSTFDTNVSNVGRLIRLLALNESRTQTVLYVNGVGARARGSAAVQTYRASIPDKGSFRALDEVYPENWIVRLAGLAGGFGVRAKVREMYRALAQCYDDRDRIFLFGFSRGAFAVRILAGLLHLVGLPPSDSGHSALLFEEAWRLYQSHDDSAMRKFRERYRPRECTIHFLGLWDTVMSYGGMKQRTFLHLRHNPIVQIVRQALALDESRSWFRVSSWGRTDSDRPSDERRYQTQDIMEVWFRGSHSVVGGSDRPDASTNLALRWMVCEAARAGIRLNEDGESLLRDPPRITVISTADFMAGESSSRIWRLADLIPRWEVDNSRRYPTVRFTLGRTGQRWPKHLTRNGQILTCIDDAAQVDTNTGN